MNWNYQWVISAEAYHLLTRLSRSRRSTIERALDRLASNPFSDPAFIGFDADGEEIFHVFVSDFIIAYHVDHATKRVLIYEIVRVE